MAQDEPQTIRQSIETIHVEVAYARPDAQRVVGVDVPRLSTAEEAIRLSKITELFPEIDLSQQAIGIFGKKVARGTMLKQGDRVEIYRPLTADPKEVRRALAALGETMGKKKT